MQSADIENQRKSLARCEHFPIYRQRDKGTILYGKAEGHITQRSKKAPKISTKQNSILALYISNQFHHIFKTLLKLSIIVRF